MKTPTCSKCGASRDMVEFGPGNRCKECIRAHDRERGKTRVRNQEKAREYAKAYRAREGVLEKSREVCRQWRLKQPPGYQKGRPRSGRAEESRAWRAAHPEKERAAQRRYQDSHPHIARAKGHRRRSLIIGAQGDHDATDIARQFSSQDGLCFYCATPLVRFDLDHKTPLSRGGTNSPENLVCACRWCNRSKGAKTAEEFAATRMAGPCLTN